MYNSQLTSIECLPCTKYCAKHFSHLIFITTLWYIWHHCPHIYRWGHRLREVEWLAYGHTASMWVKLGFKQAIWFQNLWLYSQRSLSLILSVFKNKPAAAACPLLHNTDWQSSSDKYSWHRSGHLQFIKYSLLNFSIILRVTKPGHFIIYQTKKLNFR